MHSPLGLLVSDDGQERLELKGRRKDERIWRQLGFVDVGTRSRDAGRVHRHIVVEPLKAEGVARQEGHSDLLPVISRALIKL
jgi:hypothetical protein